MWMGGLQKSAAGELGVNARSAISPQPGVRLPDSRKVPFAEKERMGARAAMFTKNTFHLSSVCIAYAAV